jgi:PAS domain S-box-containing protein
MAFSDSAEELKYLRRGMSDLVSVLALPAVWSGQEPREIVTSFHDVLMAILNLDLLYTSARIDANEEPVEILRTAQRYAATHNADTIFQALNEQFGDEPHKWPEELRSRLGGQETSLLSLRLGIDGDIGIILAGSVRTDFPSQTERLLLGVAANQAAVGLQQARLLSEQKRIAIRLEQRVADRTASLAAANENLRKEINDRMRAECALRASEINLRQIIDSISGLVCTISPAGKTELVNRPVMDYFGKTFEQLTNWTLSDSDTVHPEDLPRVIAEFTRSITTGKPFDTELRLLRFDGVYRWFHSSGRPVQDTEGRITSWYFLITDIDDRKCAEEALRTSERNLHLTINTIPALAWSARPDGSAESFNRHYLDYVGLSQEQAQDWGWTEAVHPDDRGGLVDAWQLMMKTDQGGECEARLRRFDGHYRWFLFRTNPLRDDFGRTVKWYGTNVDIEDRKRSEEALRESEQRFRLIVDGISGLVAIMSPRGELETVNNQVLTYFGKTTEELNGWSTSNAVHPDDIQGVLAAWTRSVETATVYDIDHRLLRADGEYRWFHARGLPLCDAEGRVIRWYVLLTDIHDRKQAEDALTKARAQLAHVASVTSLGAMTASIAHEVNQPLAGIVTNASTCLRMLDSRPPNIEGARETARRTIRDGNRASEVVTRLRTLFKRREVAAESMDLNDAAREVIALSMGELQSKRILVGQDFDENLPLVMGDRIQIQQVILNLLRNASDAMCHVDDRPRHLLIRTESDSGNNVQLTVRDMGVGFHPDSANRLFDSFYTTKQDGMGIGLSVSRSIIEAHHGRLWASANDGPGSTFAFSIPLDYSA